MIKAYILVETEGRDPNLVASDMTSIEDVENVLVVNGDYDLMVLVNAEDVIDLRENTLNKLSNVHGVIRTSSLIISDTRNFERI